MNDVQFRKEEHTLLLICVRPGDDRDAILRVARIIGQVRHVGGDVEKLLRASNQLVLQPFAIEDLITSLVTCTLPAG